MSTAEATTTTTLQQLRFREVGPTDLATCVALEQASYPSNEAASKSTLQYRQHHASTFFRCAVLSSSTNHHDEDHGADVVGFVCSTRCASLKHESMTTHVVGGPLLAIHSIVVREEHRRQGIATAMLKEYIQHVQKFNLDCAQDSSRMSIPIQKIVLLSKAHLLTFYIGAGFKVIRPSPVVHGHDLWYELEQELFIPWSFPCWVVDSFANPKMRGSGNPAAVVRLPDDANIEDEATKKWMQTTAQEFNLSETAFIWKWKTPEIPDDGEKEAEASEQQSSGTIRIRISPPSSSKDPPQWHYNIRYFTPTVEVPLCGHATLAAASVLFQHDDEILESPWATDEDATIVFHAAEDVLTANLAPATKFEDSGQRRISMTFPSKPAAEILNKPERDEIMAIMGKAFGIGQESILWMGVASDIGDLLVEITSDCFERLEGVHVVHNELLKTNLYTRGVIVCCRPADAVIFEKGDASDNGTIGTRETSNKKDKPDFFSRFFGPKAGIPEDPVTGSAHCVLAPYFCPLLNKVKVTGQQRSPRGGIVKCDMIPERNQVRICGLAVTTMAGKVQ